MHVNYIAFMNPMQKFSFSVCVLAHSGSDPLNQSSFVGLQHLLIRFPLSILSITDERLDILTFTRCMYIHYTILIM